jgi:hypothetical protein
MHVKPPLISTVVLVMLVFATAVFADATFAAGCLVVGDAKKPAQVKADAAAMDVPPSRNVKNCSEISVANGPVTLIFETAAGEMKSEECAPGRSCGVPQGAKEKGAALNRLAEMIRVVMAGAPERRVGGRRYDEDAQRSEHFPSGKIYGVGRAGSFDFGAAGIATWTLVVTREPGRTPIFQRSGNDPFVQLPAGLLQRGGKYGWMLTTAGKRFTGGFDVLAPGPAAEVERDLREAGVPDGPLTRKQQIDSLLVLFDHDLDHEVRLLYRELGL